MTQPRAPKKKDKNGNPLVGATRPDAARKQLAAKRRIEAVTLRKSGLSYEAIGDHLQISKVAAWKLVKTALDATLREPTMELRELEIQRLETMLRGVWPKAITGDVHAIDRAVKISERMAKLLGLDAPIRSELTGPGGGPIKAVTTDIKVDMTKDLADPERLKEVIRMIHGLGLQANFPELNAPPTPPPGTPTPEIPPPTPMPPEPTLGGGL